MNITVKLFASLQMYAPDGQAAGELFPMELPENSTLRDLVERLGIPDREVKVMYVDGRARAEIFRLHEGAEAGIFPPVGGG